MIHSKRKAYVINKKVVQEDLAGEIILEVAQSDSVSTQLSFNGKEHQVQEEKVIL